MTAPTIRDVERAICCPGGKCTSPNECYAEDRSRSYPVHIHDAAVAVAKMMGETAAHVEFNTLASGTVQARYDGENRRWLTRRGGGGMSDIGRVCINGAREFVRCPRCYEETFCAVALSSVFLVVLGIIGACAWAIWRDR